MSGEGLTLDVDEARR